GAAQHHHVHLLTFGRDSDQEAIEVLRPDLVGIEAVAPPQRSFRQRLAGLSSSLPDLASRLDSPAFRLALEKTLEAAYFDLVQVEGLEMAPCALEVCRLRGANARPLVLFDDHNAEYALQRSAFRTDLASPRRWTRAAYSFLQWRKLLRYEREVCRRADGVLAVSSADAVALRDLGSPREPRVIPNGVDTSLFGYRSVAGRQNSNGPTLVFTGTLDYRPNVDAVTWFCRRILPLIRRGHPDVRLLLVGRDPAAAVRSLAGPGISVIGPVDDVRPYLYESDVFVAPLRMGSGTRFKILEAMSCGLPVVSTTLGIEGITATPGQEVLTADRARDFAGKVRELLENPPRAHELATRARLLAEHQYDWNTILPTLEEAYRDLGIFKTIPL
ncbi:MAG: glycosyltransferase, partial [Dehalococcoidia bacterium]|nr:glycosyltransferase [Dehalococcoidia bacterium]